MTYLRICDNNETAEAKTKAIDELRRALRQFVQATDRWSLLDQESVHYLLGKCRLHCEYETLYYRIEDLQLAIYLGSMEMFRGRFRKPQTVLVLWAA